MKPLDAQARKELLLTRIALERAEWAHDVDTLRGRLTPSHLLGSLLHGKGGGGLSGALFGHRTPEGESATGWAGRLTRLALAVRRHPLWWPLLAGAWPWLRPRRGAPGRRPRSARVLAVGAAGLVAAVAGWCWVRGRNGGAKQVRPQAPRKP